MSLLAKTNQGESITEELRKLSPKTQKVLQAFRNAFGLTRRELSEITGIEICSLCSILNRLVKMEAIRELHSAPCKVTGKMVLVYASWARIDVAFDQAKAAGAIHAQ